MEAMFEVVKPPDSGSKRLIHQLENLTRRVARAILASLAR
jgi:hypothetical protein